MESLDGWYLRIYPIDTRRRRRICLPRSRDALEAKIRSLAEAEKASKLGRTPGLTHSGTGRSLQRSSSKRDQIERLSTPEGVDGKPQKPRIKPEDIALDQNDPMQSLIAGAMKAAARATAAADTARKIVGSRSQFNRTTGEHTLALGLLDNVSFGETDLTDDAEDSVEAVTAEIINEKTHHRIITASKIDELCSTMRAHTSSAAVQHWASLLLYDFVWDDQGRARLADAGGIDLLVSAMGKHATDPTVQTSICSALANLAISDDVRSRFLLAGGLPRVLTAMRKHEDRPEVLTAALRTLLSLSWNPNLRRKVRNANGLEITVHSMARHPQNAEVQEWGARLLGCFVVEAEDRAHLGSAGGVERLMASLGALPPPNGPLAARSAAAWAVVACGLRERGNQTRIFLAPPADLSLLAAVLSPRRRRGGTPALHGGGESGGGSRDKNDSDVRPATGAAPGEVVVAAPAAAGVEGTRRLLVSREGVRASG